MQKIQKLLKYLYLKSIEKDRIDKYDEIKDFPYFTKDKQDKRVLSKLNKLLDYAYRNITYYQEMFEKSGIVIDGNINLTSMNDLHRLPFLTKDIINQQKENLFSKEISDRQSYKNTSGGSTGKPVVFMQDREYFINNVANFYIAESWRGVGLYDSRLKLWGAERDIFSGKKPLISHVRDFVSNTITLNTLSMSSQDMKNFIDILNRKKPALIIAYVQSIYELAKYAKEKKIQVEKQNAIHAAAGTLHAFMREEIEDVFGCEVYNHYGSREVGAIASECNAHDGLHIMMDHTLVEVVNENGNLCKAGEEGEIVVTTLNNYSMPLIRYKIGDIGIMQEYSECNCGCTYPKLQKVLGRTTDIFKTKKGTKIYGGYFTRLFYFYGWINQFQVIQEEIDKIVVNIVTNSKTDHDNLDEIEKKIKLVMGDECEIEFKFPSSIPKTKTGKFLYTISKIK